MKRTRTIKKPIASAAHVLSADDLKLQQMLWDMPMSAAMASYAAITRDGTDLQAVKTLCLIDLFYLLRIVLKRVDLEHSWLYERCRMVERSPDGHIDLWARGHGKSSFITIGLTIQEILKNPNITCIIFSNTFTGAQGFLKSIKDELNNTELLKELFPDILYEDPEHESDLWSGTIGINVKRTTNRKEATVEIAGLVDGFKTGRHADILIFDDIVTQASVTTADQIHKTTESFDRALSLGTASARVRIIGTRYSFADTYQHLMEKGLYKARVFPATIDGTTEGDPVFFTEEQWEKVLYREKSVIACQYLLNPQAVSSKTFDLQDLSWWDVRPYRMNVYLLCDPAKTKTKSTRAADTAMLVIGVTKNKHMFLLDGFCHKMNLIERWVNFNSLREKWIRAPGIQQVQCGYETYGNDDLAYFATQMRKGLEPTTYHIESITKAIVGSNAKEARIERIEPDLKAHTIWFPYDNQSNVTNKGALTKRQAEALQHNAGSLISKPIMQKDSEGNVYDVVKLFRDQMEKYPFGRKVDLLDCFSRIYDMQIRRPSNLKDRYGSTYTIPRKPFQYGSNKLRH